MAPKLQPDENLKFLYICLQNSDYKSIDFNSVANITNLKAPAARMRFTRLVKAIECGTPIEKNGTPPQGGPEKTPEASKKRKKTVVDNADNTVNQNTLLKTVQPAIVGNDSDGGNIAPGDKAGDTSAARKSTTPPNKKVATAKKKIDTSNLASLGTDGLKPVEPEPEFHSPKG